MLHCTNICAKQTSKGYVLYQRNLIKKSKCIFKGKPSLVFLPQLRKHRRYIIHNFQSNIFMTKLNEKYCEIENPVQQLTDLTKVQHNSQTFVLFLKKSRHIFFACSRENILIDCQFIKIKITECFLITEHFYLQHPQQVSSKRMFLQKDNIFFSVKTGNLQQICRVYLHLTSSATCAHPLSHISIRARLLVPLQIKCWDTATAKETRP